MAHPEILEGQLHPEGIVNGAEGQSEGGSEKGDEKDMYEEGCNLIVNYLPQSLGEEELKKLFAPYGSIAQCKVVKDRLTKNSLGYGFIMFETADAAQAAIQALNGYAIQNKRLKVSVARPSSKNITRANLYVAGLPLAWTEHDLSALFAPFGAVVETRILYDQNRLEQGGKVPRGVGFVRLDTHENAVTAMDRLNGTTPTGGEKSLVVKFADTPTQSARRRLQHSSFGLGGLNQFGYSPPRFPAADPYRNLQAMFQPNFNFNFAQQQQQQQAQQAQQQAAAAQQQQAAALRRPQKQVYAGVCLFIYHLPPEATEDTLYHLFSQYGTVTNVKVMKDLQTGLSKGYGFVNMLTESQARQAIMSVNGFQMGNKYLKVSYKTN